MNAAWFLVAPFVLAVVIGFIAAWNDCATKPEEK